MGPITFTKMHGAGNDFVLIADPDGQLEAGLTREQVARLCHRRLGIGADGLILAQPASSDHTRPVQMVYYNADGGRSTFCGNGARCFSVFVERLGWGDLSSEGGLTFEAADGPHRAWRDARDPAGHVRLEMRPTRPLDTLDLEAFKPSFPTGPFEVMGLHWVDTGSPHLIVRLVLEGSEAQAREAFECSLTPGKWAFELAHNLRHHARWAPDGGTNVNLCPGLGQTTGRLAPVALYTFERGVEDFTLACGTGVVAAALCQASFSEPPPQQVAVRTQGGAFVVELPDVPSSGPTLIGPTTVVYEGVIPPDLLSIN